MPIYEYRCQSCDQVFEAYRAMLDSDAEVVCPNCGSKKAERVVSSFFGKTNAGGSCGPTYPS